MVTSIRSATTPPTTGRMRDRYATPTLPRAAQVGLAVPLALAGTVSLVAASDRARAIDEITVRLRPLSLDATAVYRSLASAAAATGSWAQSYRRWLRPLGPPPAPPSPRYRD